MGLTVNSNIASLNAQRNLGKINSKLGKSIERLSSGLRINKASDDAAGLAIATKLGTQVRGLNQAVRNANNAITLVQTAEGGINTVTNILHRLRELAVQSASGDNTASDRSNLTSEATNLTSELTRMVNTTEFNTTRLLDGSFNSKFFQIGANFSQKLTFTIGDVRGKSIGGRAEYSADIADGVAAATDENLGTGEIKINGVDVAATNATDDQYSVLSLKGSAALDNTLSAGNISLNINGTSVGLTIAGADSGAITANQLVASAVAAINAASITNVTARAVDGSILVIDAKKGANLNMAMSATMTSAAAATSALMSAFGLTGATSAMIGSGTGTLVNNYNGESSAVAKAAAINSVESGVTATAASQTVTGSSAVTAGTIAAGDVYINGVDIGAATITAQDGTGALITAINNKSSDTGVTAKTDNDGKLSLTAADGRNITAEVRTGTVGGYLNLSGTASNNVYLYRSTVQLNDDESFSLTSASSLEDLTGTAGTSASAASDVNTYNIATISISTQATAEASILTIDAAMDDVNSTRAQIGAVQNRLEFTVANLEIASENSAAAESRILDADFAVETATFTRNQIMVQAATAMLAQANTLPQAALQLLG